MKLKPMSSKINKKSKSKDGSIKKTKNKNATTKKIKKVHNHEKSSMSINKKKNKKSRNKNGDFEMDADNNISGFKKFKGKNDPNNREDSVDEESYDGNDGEDNDDVDYYDRENQEEDDEDENSQVGESEKHVKSLKKLKETDPDFYKFLEENDKRLLEFKHSDEESASEDEETEKIHKPPEKLEVDSEDSDFEPEEPEEGQKKKDTGVKIITIKMVGEWQNNLRSNTSMMSTLTDVVMAFHAALEGISGEEKAAGGFRVDGSAVFNAVIQMCVLDLPSALLKFLKLPQGSTSKIDPSKSKRWTKVKNLLKSYFTDLLKLLGGVTSSNILTVLLKHLHQMSNFVTHFHSITRQTLRMLIKLWSSSEETVRVVAFLCILRFLTNQQKGLLDSVLRKMYVSYVQNSKFVSVSTLSDISFMRRSLSELFALDQRVSYQHAFLYIRQLAIHLRNAVTLRHKKEHIQTVCNWQFMNSLRLWTDVLCLCADKSVLTALQYPLIQIIIGCIKLVPSAQYLPLRFHCCELLTKFTKETGTFIPVLPFILEALTLVDYNKWNRKVSMKPMDFTCVLRLSKTAMIENGFRDANIEHVYQLLIEYTTAESHRLSFPDVVVPTTMQLRSFLKTCKISKYTQKLKQAMNKIEETAKFVEAERQKVVINLADKKAVEAFEARLKVKGTPLAEFHKNWLKVHMHQVAKRATNNEKIGEYKLPSLKKVKKDNKKPVDDEGDVELFPSEDSDDGQINFGDDNDMSESPMKKMKKKQKQEKREALKKQEELKKSKTKVKLSKKQKIKGRADSADKYDNKNNDNDDDDDDDVEDIVDDFHMSDIE